MKRQKFRRLFTFGVTVCLTFAIGNVFSGSEGSGLEAVADQFHTALSDGDVATINELLDPNVLIFESGGVESSREEYASHHMHSDMKFIAGMDREIISRQVTQDEAMAVVSTSSKLVGSYQDNQLDLASTETLVLKKGDHGWRIHHIHWSSKSNN